MIWTFSEPQHQAVWVIWWDTGWEERSPRPAVQVRRLRCQEIFLSWWDLRTSSWLLFLTTYRYYRRKSIFNRTECQNHSLLVIVICYFSIYLWSSWARLHPDCLWCWEAWRPDTSGISAYRQPLWSCRAGPLMAGSGRRGTWRCSDK